MEEPSRLGLDSVQWETWQGAPMPYFNFDLIIGADFKNQGGMILEDREYAFEKADSLASELCIEGLALDERHDVVEQVAGGARGEEGDDVRMLQGGGQLDLALEPLGLDRRGHLGREYLDDGGSVELGIEGPVNGSLTPRPDLLEYLVLIDLRTDHAILDI